MTKRVSDEQLRGAYALLMQRRAASGLPPAIPVEEVQALAEGTYVGADRDARLDVVLSDPRTAAEFEFFLDLAREQPTARRALPRWLPVAASIVMTVGVLAVWRASVRPVGDEPLRGGATVVELLRPAVGDAIEPGTLFSWHPVASASDYLLDVIDEEGNSLLSASTIDTTYLMPADLMLAPGMEYRWWVVARLLDGTEVRAEPRTNPGR